MGLVTFAKGYIRTALLARGVTKVHLQAEANANYQVPYQAVVLVSEDATTSEFEKHEKFGGTKDDEGHYNHDGRLRTYRSHRKRKLVLEATVIGPTEAWVDDLIWSLLRDIPRTVLWSTVALEPPPEGGGAAESGDVYVDVAFPQIIWHDDESLLRTVSAAQLYIEFSTPCFRAVREPHWEEVEMTPNLTTDI